MRILLAWGATYLVILVLFSLLMYVAYGQSPTWP